MANVFTLYGEIKTDTRQFTKSIQDAEKGLEEFETTISQTESKSKSLGDTTARTARQFDKFREDASRAEQKLRDVINSANRGEKSTAQLARAFETTGNRLATINSRVKDFDARMSDAANKSSALSSRLTASTAAGNLMANAISRVTDEAQSFVVEGVRMNATLDKLTRFTATLDKNFQTPIALKQFRDDIKQLSTEIPFSAEKIAEASFSIKSAFSGLNRKDTVEFLRQFGLAATASNADIADFTKNTVALAKVFKVELKDLPTFMSKVNATFKQGLAADSEVAQGFNRLTTSITAAKLSTEDFLAAFSTIQSTTADAAGATTNLQNALAKLGDAKYIEELDKVFNIDRFTKDGGLKSLNELVNELAKSLKGLTDEQKLNKLNAVFKDLQANQGILALINNVDTYNNLLKDASGAEAFKATQNLMMDSVESRWTRLWNNIKNDQAGIGDQISNIFLAAFDSTTVVGGIAIFFNNLGGAVLEGAGQLGLKVATVVADLGDQILSNFLDEATIAEGRAKVNANWKSILDGISNTTEENARYILENQKKYWQKIAESTADPEAKATALKNIDSLTKSIQASVNKSNVDLYESFKGLMDSAVKGLASNNDQIKAQAQQTAQGLVDSINKVLADPNLDPAMAKEFRALLDELIGIADKYGVTLKKVSFTLGANIGEGLVKGIMSKRDDVATAAVILAKSAIVPTEQTLQTASPSKVFIKIGEHIVNGLILGMEGLNSNLKASVTKLMKDSITTAKESLGKAFTDLQILKSDELFRFTVNQSAIEKVKDALQELIDLRIELGANLNSPLPKLTEDITAELDALKAYKELGEQAVNTLGDFIKEFTPATAKLEQLNQALANPATNKLLEDKAKALGLTVDYLREYLRLNASLADEAANPLSGGNGSRGSSNLGIGTGGIVDVDGSDAPAFKTLSTWEQVISRIKENFGGFADNVRSNAQILGDSLSDVAARMGNIFYNAIDSANGFFSGVLDGFKNFAKQLIAEMTAVLVVALAVGAITAAFGGSFTSGFKSVTGSGNGGTGGGILAGIFNRGGSSSGSGLGGLVTSSAGGLSTSGRLETFATGGFTGFGNAQDIAGIVHKNEYVVNARSVNALGGASGVEAKLGGNSRPVVINANFYTQDAESFRRSESQIKRQLSSAVMEGLKNS